jgi:hypothetical protein
MPILIYRINYWSQKFSETKEKKFFYLFYEVLQIYQAITKNSVIYGWNDSEFYIKLPESSNSCCEFCAYSTILPQNEQSRWLRPGSLVYCKKIPQAVDKIDRCNFFKVN